MSDYAMIFMMGLLGSVHCLAMCGGLIMACSARCGGGARFSAEYNAGRVLTYVVLGAVMGLAGRTLASFGLFGGFQGMVPAVAGAAMILIGLDLLGVIPPGVKGYVARLLPGVLAEGLFPGGSGGKKGRAPFVVGMLNGLVPCGLLYAVGVKAAATTSPVEGALVMAALGAGTFVPLLFAGTLTGLLDRRRAGLATTLSSVIIIALGVKSIFVGAGGMHMMHM